MTVDGDSDRDGDVDERTKGLNVFFQILHKAAHLPQELPHPLHITATKSIQVKIVQNVPIAA